MGFQHENGHEAIRFHPEGISGVSALDGYLLRFSVSYSLSAWRGEFGTLPSVFHNFHARAELDPGRLRLGSPIAEIPLVITTHEHDQPGSLAFELLVSASTIEKIEEVRLGAGFNVRVAVSGERVAARYATQHDDVYFRISHSEWIEVLKQMDYGTLLLCEIPIEVGDDGELREAWTVMTQAHALLHAGHYSNVVVACRKALETTLKKFDLDTAVQLASQKYQGNRSDRASMTKRERVLNLINSANHATHLGAHPDTNNEMVDYSRREALLIFSVVAATIADISERNILAEGDN